MFPGECTARLGSWTLIHRSPVLIAVDSSRAASYCDAVLVRSLHRLQVEVYSGAPQSQGAQHQARPCSAVPWATGPWQA